MLLETPRLIIRSLQPSDEKAFIDIASDGSLAEIYGDCRECHKWMGKFIREAITLEKAGFSVIEIKMYRDLHDEIEEMHNIYEWRAPF